MYLRRKHNWLVTALVSAVVLAMSGLAFSADDTVSADDLLGDARLAFVNRLSFDPTSARHLDDIRDSLRMSVRERHLLAQNGFVLMEDQPISFAQAYDSIYVEDLPVFISADMLQYAIHRSYDAILKRIEEQRLIPELRTLLGDMRRQLCDGSIDVLGPEARADVDVYLAVPLALLTGGPIATVAGGDQTLVQQLVDMANQASGAPSLDLFGSNRFVDASQFTPRGHYTDSPELERYFKAMMWLGRIDVRMIETLEMGGQVFNRRQFYLAAGLDGVLDPASRERQRQIAEVIATFVGQSDNMRPAEFPGLYSDLGISGASQVPDLDDTILEAALRAGRYGAQRIASHIVSTLPGLPTMPLSSTFLLFGQVYIIDSEVLANVVFDRIPSLRLMPNPLDVAYAALGNDQAANLLEDEIRRWNYAGALGAMRSAVDTLPADFWSSNLYNLWLNALRQLSPGDELDDPRAAGLPSVFTTEAWGRRLLNTQLASWAELRHDTLLYAKQSYTSSIGCSYPDVYVDPYPEYFRAVAEYAAAGHVQMAALGIRDLDTYFARLGEIANNLAEMADRQRQGQPLTDEHRRFAEGMVRLEDVGVCGTEWAATGWYAELFVAGADPLDFDPTIADVHTQPSDEQGNPVGRILHVGTGHPRLMTVTVDTPQGVRAFVGAVSSYYEVTTENFHRLTDEQWAGGELEAAPNVPWLNDLIAE